ncbi:MAG TPA: diguanylate cyclase [Kineosporiaceae bacterium]
MLPTLNVLLPGRMLYSADARAEQTGVSRNVIAAVVLPLAVIGVVVLAAVLRAHVVRRVPSDLACPTVDDGPVDALGRAVTVVPGRPLPEPVDPEPLDRESLDHEPLGVESSVPEVAAPAPSGLAAWPASPPGERVPVLVAAPTRAVPVVPGQPEPIDTSERPADAEPAAQRVPRRRGATGRQQAQLAGLAERLAAVDGRQDVAARAMHEAATLVGADTSALVVRSVAGPRVLAQHPAGDDPELWGARTLAALLARPEPVRLALDGDPLAGGARTALVTAPVPAGGGSVGVVVARRRSGIPFTVSDQDALVRLARIAGARLHLTPERSAVVRSAVDRATGLGRHDLLMADLAQALRSRPEHGLPATLVVAEVVGLARLRTERGMAAADAAAAAIAARVGSELRMGDLMYRTNADELAVLLPATDATGGAAVARRLDETVIEEAFGLSLRSVMVPVEESPEAVLLRVMRALAAARVSERWTGPPAQGPEGRTSS